MVVSSSDRDVAAVNVAQPPSSPAPVQEITPFPYTSVPQNHTAGASEILDLDFQLHLILQYV